jgi:hypothetical protein
LLGTGLVILYASPHNWTGRLLSLPPFVGIGLISYSAYLWHQPIFALARVRFYNVPDGWTMAALTLSVIPIAYLSWRFIEQPFRNPKQVPLRAFAPTTASLAVALLCGGFYLHLSHGAPERIFPNAKPGDLYITYNERIRSYRADEFPQNDRENVLILGNSIARDITNTMMEGGFTANKNIVYREDLPGDCQNFLDHQPVYTRLFNEADYIVVTGMAPDCAAGLVKAAHYLNKKALAFGPKDFGYNLNPFISVPMKDRPAARTFARAEAVRENAEYQALIPVNAYFDLMNALGNNDGGIPVFDAEGNILSQDRVHFTQYGAKFASPIVVKALESLNDLPRS